MLMGAMDAPGDRRSWSIDTDVAPVIVPRRNRTSPHHVDAQEERPPAQASRPRPRTAAHLRRRCTSRVKVRYPGSRREIAADASRCPRPKARTLGGKGSATRPATAGFRLTLPAARIGGRVQRKSSLSGCSIARRSLSGIISPWSPSMRVRVVSIMRQAGDAESRDGGHQAPRRSPPDARRWSWRPGANGSRATHQGRRLSQAWTRPCHPTELAGRGFAAGVARGGRFHDWTRTRQALAGREGRIASGKGHLSPSSTTRPTAWT